MNEARIIPLREVRKAPVRRARLTLWFNVVSMTTLTCEVCYGDVHG